MVGFVGIGISAFMRIGISAFMDIDISENIWVTCEECLDAFEVRRDIAYEMWREQDESGIPICCPICLDSDGTSDVIELGPDWEIAPTKW